MNDTKKKLTDKLDVQSSRILTARSIEKIDRIILHIGTRKTGSTNLQNRLRDNQDILLEQGFKLVVGRGRAFKEIYLNILSGSQDWMLLIAECLAEAKEANATNLIITSEDLFYLNEWKIAELVVYCKTLAKRVEVHGFFRRQDDYIESSYTQYTTAGLWVGNIQTEFEYFLKATIKNIDYKYGIDSWVAACGKRNFKPTFYVKKDTAKIFLDNIGVVLPDPASDVSRNMREPADLLRGTIFIGEAIADHYGMGKYRFCNLNKHFNFRENIRHPLAKAFAATDVNTDKYWFLPRENMNVLQYEFEEMNESLLKEFKGEHDKEFADFTRKDIKCSELGVRHMSPVSIEIVMNVLSVKLATFGKQT